jgi:hypothetical protein
VAAEAAEKGLTGKRLTELLTRQRIVIAKREP